MKQKLLYVIFSLFVTIGYSQQADYKLLKVYSQQEIAEIKQKDISLYNALIYGVDNATYISDWPTGKDISDWPSISLKNNDYSFATVGVKIIEDKNQYFKIDGTKKILVVKSALVLKNELNNKQQ